MSAEASTSSRPSAIVGTEAASGLSLSLHPLPILNISEHYTRSRFIQGGGKLIGALLGTQSNRDVSIVNSFELILGGGDNAENGDVDMGDQTEGASVPAPVLGPEDLNLEFLERRRDQFKQVFPTLDVIGWYTVGQRPSLKDIALHRQFLATVDSPLFLLFDPDPKVDARDIPVIVYEATLNEGDDAKSEGKFLKLDYAIETGEAERIAVDGVSRGGLGEGGESTVVGNLTTQRNAIRMLYERISVILQYVTAVVNNTARPDHAILRQVSSLVASLPTMDNIGFQDELMTEYSDVQLTRYLADLTKHLSALSEYADKHHTLFPGGRQGDALGEEVSSGGPPLSGWGNGARRGFGGARSGRR